MFNNDYLFKKNYLKFSAIEGHFYLIFFLIDFVKYSPEDHKLSSKKKKKW